MYKINTYVMYRHDICIISNIKNINNIEYYVLHPVYDNTLTINIPTTNKTLLNNIITKENANILINNIPNIKIIDNHEDKNIEQKYKELLNSGNHEDLVKIIKTTYLRNQKRSNNKKKISEKDNIYFSLAEKYLYSELSISLGIEYNNVKEYIKNVIEKKND